MSHVASEIVCRVARGNSVSVEGARSLVNKCILCQYNQLEPRTLKASGRQA